MPDLTVQPAAFADDPVASHSARFGLARPLGTPAGSDAPSPAGIRPWNLRFALVVSGQRARVAGWRYDHQLQVAVADEGKRVADIVAADPSAESVSHLDGDEGASEDWRYDFHPDHTGDPA
ncbi:hypothetical protein AB0A74_00880 [Saccharothrix sp. NPDC042600]|uniref:hypothetical protein n=1 Tax=Saccharothrix TaxID=2071 RepID=UPI0033E8E3B0|nr:hypothetical protein GCM10017745_48790 [Saccharothrix mutabilis subsp. capreolus]